MSLDINRFKDRQSAKLPKFKSDVSNHNNQSSKLKPSNKAIVYITLVFLAILIAIVIGAIIYGQNNPKAKYEHHKNNVDVLCKTIDENVAENLVIAMENTHIITQNYRMESGDVLECGNGEYEIYVGVSVRVVTNENNFKLYIYKAQFNVSDSILIYDSTNESSMHILEKDERENYRKSQRKYLVENTIKVVPSTGILLHNSLGGSQLTFSINNTSDTDIDNISITIAPGLLGGVVSKYKSGTYTTYESVRVGQIKEYTLNPKGWSDYDTFEVIGIVIYFSDGTAITFDEYDCQFL